MVEGKFRSGRLARVHKKMPGGKSKLTFQRRNPGAHKCSTCGIQLKGIPRLSLSESRTTAKSKKTVERAYGGFLCPSCLKQKLKLEARSIQ